MSATERQGFLKDIGRRTRVLRLHLDLTEQEMAEQLDISVGALRRWEAGTRRSSRGMAPIFVRMGERFNVSIDWLSMGAKAGHGDENQPIRPDLRPVPKGQAVRVADAQEIAFIQLVRRFSPQQQDDLLTMFEKYESGISWRDCFVWWFVRNGLTQEEAEARAAAADRERML